MHVLYNKISQQALITFSTDIDGSFNVVTCACIMHSKSHSVCQCAVYSATEGEFLMH